MKVVRFLILTLMFMMLGGVSHGQDAGIQQYEREVVRLIYFRPSDRPSRQSIDTELDTLIRWSQYFFAEQMQDYGRKTFAFETDTTGYAKVHHITGKFTDTYYHSDTYDKVVNEVMERFDTSRDVFLIAVDVSSEFINNEGTCGIGGGGWTSFDSELWRREFGGTAVIPASGVCINPSITAHELGHVFGLEHDFRDDAYLMAYGIQERLSPCAAEWLDAHRFFNNDPTVFNEAATMDIHASNTSTPGNLSLQFELTDADGLHQAQLIVPTTATDPAQGTKLHSCKSLSGERQTVGFITTDLTVKPGSEVTLQVIDDRGGITKQTFSVTIEAPLSNRSPVAVGTIPEQTLTLGGSAVTLSIASYFSDPDGDVLRYKAQSNNTRVVGVRLSGTQITIAPRTVGSTSVAVTASDGKSLVTQRISVHVKDATALTQNVDTIPDNVDTAPDDVNTVPDADRSLILYFSFDEINGNQTIDHSQHQNHGTLIGNPQLVDGKFGKALEFNGVSDWVEVPHHDSLTVDKDVTVMAWIHTPRYHGPGGALWQGIVGKSNNPRSYSFYTEADGQLHLSVSTFIGSSSDEKIALNEWQHVVAQVDSGWHRYWINGKNVGNFLIDAPLPGKADTASVLIGNTHDILPAHAPNRQFLGLIDEVRIYNRALSEAEIIQRMESGYQDTPPGPATTTGVASTFDDAFDGTALQNPNWQWQNEPANWDVGETRDGFLHIEGETNRNLWASDASHFLYQETDADTFDVETHFFSKWDTSSGVNGLVVKSPADNNWVTIKFWSRDAGAKGQIQYQTRGRGLVADPAWRPEFGATELFLRLRKHGDTYTGWYKTRAADPWIEIGVANFPLTPPLQLGIYTGVAAGAGTLTVDYDYFRSTVDTGVLASPVLHVAAMEAPTQTTLLPNYPNPFNPETWIPYQLASPSDVTVRIYAINGNLVRRLLLGHQAAGMYHGRSRAAYWDGKNQLGEPVASGVYFYTLTAGDFNATRKMLIRK